MLLSITISNPVQLGIFQPFVLYGTIDVLKSDVYCYHPTRIHMPHFHGNKALVGPRTLCDGS